MVRHVLLDEDRYALLPSHMRCTMIQSSHGWLHVPLVADEWVQWVSAIPESVVFLSFAALLLDEDWVED